MTTSPVSATSSGALTVQTPAKVPTKHGAVDAVIKREIPYSKLVSPWKKALRAVPLVGTGLVIVDILAESCIRPTTTGMFEQCYKTEQEAPYQIGYYAGSVMPAHSQLMDSGQAQAAAREYSQGLSSSVRNFGCSVSSAASVMFLDGKRHGSYVCTFEYLEPGTTNTWSSGGRQYQPAPRCGNQAPVVQEVPGQPYPRMYCLEGEIEGYNPVAPEVAESALNNPPSGSPDHVRDKVFKLWEELKNLPDDLPQDARSVDATGLSSPTITPKTPADTAKAGPKTSETTSTGTKVTQETSTITYQGDKTTVINNTTITNINNAGDIVDESTTTEQGPTDCEKNPSAIACLELGEPPSGDIPRKDDSWQITAESLPGGSCPGGFVWPVPGNPEFSWQPLCDRLPAVRAVLLVLASVLAAWIVVGGLQS